MQSAGHYFYIPARGGSTSPTTPVNLPAGTNPKYTVINVRKSVRYIDHHLCSFQLCHLEYSTVSMVCQVSGPPEGVAAALRRSFPEVVPPLEFYHKFVLLSRGFFFFRCGLSITSLCYHKFLTVSSTFFSLLPVCLVFRCRLPTTPSLYHGSRGIASVFCKPPRYFQRSPNQGSYSA